MNQETKDRLTDIAYIIAGAACTVALLGVAEANDRPTYTPRPQPTETYPADDFAGWKMHIGASAVIGSLTYAAIPNAHWAVQGAICLLPGHIRENRRQHQPGNRYSEKDMISNAVGCGLGIALTHQVKVRVAPNWVGLEWVLP